MTFVTVESATKVIDPSRQDSLPVFNPPHYTVKKNK